MNYFVLKHLREREGKPPVKTEKHNTVMDNEKSTIHITNNYYAPIGQKIDHVDKIDAHFDKEMGMHIGHADAVDGEQVSAEELPVTTPLEWCHAGIRSVVEGGKLEFSSDWAAVMKIIREVSVFDTLTPSGMVQMIRESGVVMDDDHMPNVDNIRRVEVNGKFPEWTTKGYDSTSRYLRIAKDFLQGYRAMKQ